MASFRRFTMRIDWIMIGAIALALPIITLTPLLSHQLPGTNDAELHLHRLISAALNMRNGILWPRWSPNLHFGFGYPLGNFYAPGWHIAGAVLVILGVSPVTVVLLAQTVGIMLYPAGGYLLGRQLGGKGGALLGAAVFLYAPFRFYELFEQGNISQLLAMGLMPWVLWAIGRCSKQPSRNRVALGGLLLAVLVVTHHPTAFAFLPFAGLYALLVGFSAAPHRYRVIAPLAAFALGAMISAIYWLPALDELQYVRVQQATSGLYQVQTSFVPLNTLFNANQPPDRAALNPTRPFNAGQAGLFVAAIGLAAGLLPCSRLSRWQRSHVIGGAVVIIGCLYLMTDQSEWLWRLVPPAQAIQFPWRLMGVLTVATIPGAVTIIELLAPQWRRFGMIVGLLIIIIAALPAMPPIKTNVTEPAIITPGTSIRYEAVSGNLGAVSTYEYTPRWSTQRPLFDPCAECYDAWTWFIRVNQASVPSQAQISSGKSNHRSGTQFQITTPLIFELELHQFYFPGWQITLDGLIAPIHITDPFGLMAVDIPAGTHVIEAWYDGTLAQHLGDALAVFGISLCAVLFVLDAKRKRQPLTQAKELSDRQARRIERRLGLGVTGLLVSLAVAIYPTTDLFRADGSPSQPRTASLLLHKIFSDTNGKPLIELVGADLPLTVIPGQQLLTRLYWHALQKLDAGWRVALKIQDIAHKVDWANSDNVVPGGYSTDNWPLNKYIIDTHSLTLSVDTLPYVDDFTVRVYKDSGAQLITDSPTVASLRVLSSHCDMPSTSATVHFSNLITLSGYALNDAAGHITLDLFWNVDAPIKADYALFVHGMAGNTSTTNADSAPIEAYPSYQWRAGQCLRNRYMFDTSDNTDRLLIGFYDRVGGQRLTATSGSSTENNGLVIPLR